MCKIRNLRADEIECRPGQISNNSTMLLLYKDARCDMKILDETFEPFGWKRKHEVINGNLFCTVSIRNPETGEWVEKQDVGTESNTEKQKGEASDAFKRACTNIGIGRELYSSPPIWIKLKSDEMNNGKLKSSVKFYVSCIETDEDKQITCLNIIDKNGENRFVWNKASLKFHEIITKMKAEDAAKAERNEQPEPDEPEFVTDKDKTFIISAFKQNIGNPKDNPDIYKEVLSQFGATRFEEIKRVNLQPMIEYIKAYKPESA